MRLGESGEDIKGTEEASGHEREGDRRREVAESYGQGAVQGTAQ